MRGGPLGALFRADRLLVLAAHPDDEALGCGGLLLRRAGRDQLVFATDGGPVDFAPGTRGFASREAYVAARRAESVAAAALLGIPDEGQHRLPFADKALPIAALARALVALIRRLTPDVLLTHPYEGGHPDHDAAACAAAMAEALLRREGQPAPPRFEFTSYHLADGALRGFEFLPAAEPVHTLALDPAQVEAKRRLLGCYASQAAMLARFPLAVERFRSAPAYRFDRPPHQGTLFYETFPSNTTPASWRARVWQAVSELGLPPEAWISSR